MDSRIPDVPEFDSFRAFVAWWESPEVVTLRIGEPAVADQLKAHPNVHIWLTHMERAMAGPTPSESPVEAAPPTFEEGSNFGKYKIRSQLGEGGMGVVYEAWDTSLSRTVALKLITYNAFGADSAERFMREARTAAQLNHPNILQVFEVAEQDGMRYIAMEYADAGSFDSVRGAVSSGKMTFSAAIEMFRRVVDAVGLAHRHDIVHRDIKPENILLKKAKDGSFVPKIADFGLAKELSSDVGLTASGVLLGTPGFMSPEQAESKEATTQSDVFSLGVLAYWLCTGFSPFQRETVLDTIQAVVEFHPRPPSRRSPNVDHDLDTMILKALEKDPSRRYPSAVEFAEDLARYLAGEPILARPASLSYTLTRKVRKHRSAVIGLSVAIVAVLGLGMTAYFVLGHASKNADIAAGYFSEAERLFETGDIVNAKANYANALAVLGEDDGIEARLRECETLIAESDRLARESDDETLKAWLMYTQLSQEFLKEDSDFASLWKKLDAVEAKLTKAISMRPTDLAYLYRGMVRRERNAIEAAREDFSKAIELNPGMTIAYILRGIATYGKFLSSSHVESADSVPDEEIAAIREQLLESVMRDFEVAEKGKESMPALGDVYKRYWILFNGIIEMKKHPGRAHEIFDKGYLMMNSEEFLYWDGLCYMLEMKLVLALERFDAALKMKRSYIDAWSAKLTTIRSLNDREGAIAAATEAIKVAPFEGQFYFQRGVVRQEVGDLDGAFADFTVALESPGERQRAFLYRADLRQEMGDYEGSLADYAELLRMNPKDPDALNNRAWMKMSHGDIAGAIADYDTALSGWLRPRKRARVLANRGEAKYKDKDYAGAEADMTEAIGLGQELYDPFFFRGNLRLMKSDMDGAIADYGEAVNIKPDSAEAYCQRGLARRRKGELDLAMADFDSAIVAQPEFYKPRLYRGLVRKARGDFKGALEDFDFVLSKDPYVIDAMLERGNIRYEAGEFALAEEDYSKAIEGGYKGPIAMNRLAMSQIAIGRYGDAVVSATLCIENENPMKAHYAYDTRGMAHVGLKENDKALADFDKALAIKHDYVDSLVNRGKLYRDLGRREEALADLRKAMEFEPSLRGELEKIVAELEK